MKKSGSITRKINHNYLRSVIFGIEDSLVSIVGVLFGISTALHDLRSILLTGFVVIAVEALSMGAGAFLSEQSVHEVTKAKHKDVPWINGLVMFFSYFISGFIPLLPYMVIPNLMYAKVASVLITALTLFVVGYIPTKKVFAGFRMAFVAGFAILIGYAIGNLY